jgi:CheY-like chemotaxis protein
MSKLLINALLPPYAVKKRILLVDTFATRRDLRAKVMRKLGIEVDCAADISEARSLWRADSYNLVLMNVRNELQNVSDFCCEIKNAKPPQRVAFLVGKPEYLASSQDAEGTPIPEDDGHGPWAEMVSTLFANSCESLPNRWGIREASWRIAAARSLKDPRRNGKAGNGRAPSWADAVKENSKVVASELTTKYEEIS